jgi:hypothetical protein
MIWNYKKISTKKVLMKIFGENIFFEEMILQS